MSHTRVRKKGKDDMIRLRQGVEFMYKNKTNNLRLIYNETKTEMELIGIWAQTESLIKGQRKLNSKIQDRLEILQEATTFK